jgi:outer membrane protein TolC
MLKRAIIFTILILWPFLAFSDDVPSDVIHLGLRDALSIARERHADIIMADERVQQALARLGQARSGVLPQLRGVVSGSRQSRDLRGQGISLPGDPHIGPFNAFDARVKLTQAIFDPAAVGRLDAASKGKQLSIAEERKVDEDVLALVATFFISARQSSEHLKAQKAVLKSDLQSLHAANAKFKQGTASAIEFEQAKGRYAQSYFFSSQAQTQETQARLELCAALDLPMDQEIKYMSDDLVVRFSEEDLKLLDQHPDISVAQKDVKLKVAERGLERSQWLPQISALADYGKSGESPDESSNTYTVGLQATVPIWEGGNRENRIKEATSRMKESQVNLEEVKRATKARLLTAVETIKQAEAFMAQVEVEFSVTWRESQLAVKKYEIGNGSRLDIIEGQASMAVAHSQKADALATYQLAQINLAHALGRMQELFNKEK